LNLDRSINNLSKRIERFDSFNDCDGNGSNHWKSKEIIPLNDWIQHKGTSYALEFFPDDFDEVWAHMIEDELREDGDDQTRKWYSDYLDLMEHKRNPNYGKSKCFPLFVKSS
jgi:phenolic acid decarboxylase